MSKSFRLGKGVNQHKRTYHKEVGMLIGLLIGFFTMLVAAIPTEPEVYTREPDVYMTAIVVEHPQDESIETKIRKDFPRHGSTMIAIAHAESGMSMKAVGYNCFYSGGKATTTPIKGGSKACKVEDRGMAWSVDCFALQKNYIGKECPKGVTADEHLKEVADLSRVQGLNAWTVYRTGAYKRYLAQQ